MTFDRSAAGQANRAPFYGVDFTCYVEGEDQRDSGDDIYFWHIIFSTLRPDVTIKYLSRGGKPQLEALARQTIEEDVKDVFVAMDADYTRFFAGRLLDDPRIFYTYGYCWENDVFQPGVDEQAYADIARMPSIPSVARDLQQQTWLSIHDFVKRLMKADFFAFRCGGSVVQADKPGRFFVSCPEGFPQPRKSQAISAIATFASQHPDRAPIECMEKPEDPWRYAKGKMLAFLLRKISGSSAAKFSAAKQITEAHLKHICLAVLRAQLLNPLDSAVANHHINQVARIPI